MQRFHTLAAAVLLAVCAAVNAADLTPAESSKDALAGAREHIAAKRWSAAIDELKRVNATDNADWNNLMGYSMRKQKTPDFAAAEAYYDAALRIAPAHRGALEYSGELYLMKGDLGQAEKRLATLDKACTFSCAEYRELKQAVERYKANGNQYVSAW
ncbi:MAG: tetratricopeptide repeat protein [Betaproteobacteria bacterium]|nr:MAG: tetratricopeptide repeat protein [Betaproteobacteria bacterium]